MIFREMQYRRYIYQRRRRFVTAYKHCEYHSLEYLQVEGGAQTVGPLKGEECRQKR